jgi:carboxyl-terminal processing protease
LHELLDQDPRAIIFDLRGNGGGLLEQAEIVADLFLDEGLIVIQRSRQEEDQRTYADGGDEGEDIPLVVLIDGGSASASEVVSGALQDRDRAVLIGQPSFGKGIVQSIFDLSDGSQLKLTTSAWYTPDDRAIHGEGLEPDILIEGDQYADGIDRPLQAAIDHINENVEPTQG